MNLPFDYSQPLILLIDILILLIDILVLVIDFITADHHLASESIYHLNQWFSHYLSKVAPAGYNIKPNSLEKLFINLADGSDQSQHDFHLSKSTITSASPSTNSSYRSYWQFW